MPSSSALKTISMNWFLLWNINIGEGSEYFSFKKESRTLRLILLAFRILFSLIQCSHMFRAEIKHLMKEGLWFVYLMMLRSNAVKQLLSENLFYYQRIWLSIYYSLMSFFPQILWYLSSFPIRGVQWWWCRC